ncbi:SpoVR family protein [bacterium]|jgi:stage V sporulation protein R|nr:SpoVR family protein [bacterium]
MDLTPELMEWQEKIKKVARDEGLDFFETIFYLLPYSYLTEIASHGGFPVRYPHWHFGLEHEKLKRSYEWGMGKIYELVINNDPCHAYLLENNSTMEQKLVIAHVYGHCDFFKNNIYFASTNRRMMDDMANHASRVDSYIRRYGAADVERFIDACLSIQDHISPLESTAITTTPAEELETEEELVRIIKRKANPENPNYMDIFLNSPEYLDFRKKQLEEKLSKEQKFPPKPLKDILYFLLLHAPLKKWQEDILYIIRKERYYFIPQGFTKILNEGWASYWHFKLMTEQFLESSEFVNFGMDHSGTLAKSPYQLNPYYLGFTLLHDVEERWNRGQFGPEWEDCSTMFERNSWDKKLGLGREKIFEIRSIENDYSFVDKYLTEDYCDKHKMFKYNFDPQSGQWVLSDRSFESIKNQLLEQLANFGIPHIVVQDGNYKNRGELYLLHHHEGDLRQDYAWDTLENIAYIWRRPVHLETMVDGKAKLYSFIDGDTKELTDIS